MHITFASHNVYKIYISQALKKKNCWIFRSPDEISGYSQKKKLCKIIGTIPSNDKIFIMVQWLPFALAYVVYAFFIFRIDITYRLSLLGINNFIKIKY